MGVTETSLAGAKSARAQAPSGGQLRVALISGHPLYRDGFAQALRTAHNMVLLEGGRAADAIAIAKERLADIVLIDLHDLTGGSIDMALSLARDYPEVRIVVLSDSERAIDATNALEAGISGYVHKTVQGAELLEIIRGIHEGRKYIAPQLPARAILLKCSRPSAEKELSKLTPREEEIFVHVSRGMTNKEIARALQISEKTVKHHMSFIMKKLRVRNRVEAALAARWETSPAK